MDEVKNQDGSFWYNVKKQFVFLWYHLQVTRYCHIEPRFCRLCQCCKVQFRSRCSAWARACERSRVLGYISVSASDRGVWYRTDRSFRCKEVNYYTLTHRQSEHFNWLYMSRCFYCRPANRFSLRLHLTANKRERSRPHSMRVRARAIDVFFRYFTPLVWARIIGSTVTFMSRTLYSLDTWHRNKITSRQIYLKTFTD